MIKEPVWTWEVPVYFLTGGLAGASSGLAFGAGLAGNPTLARRAWLLALAGVAVSPALLVSDLGRPERFLNMLRVFKVTSPMNVGSWLLSATGAAVGLAAAHEAAGLFPRAGRAAKPVAAVLGAPLATYTAVLVANTANPVWSEARRELPFVFAGSAAASAGAAAAALTPAGAAGPARRLAVGGALASQAAALAMERRLGEVGEPYREGRAGRFARAARALTVAGAGLMASAGRGRARTLPAAGLVLAAVLCERWAVFSAGFQSARDPRFTVGPQRRRVAERSSR